MLTNKLAAELNGFGCIYKIVEESKAIYWSDLNTKLLSNDLDKLAPTLRLIYTLVQLYQNIHSSTATYYDILGNVNAPIFFKDMSVLLKKLKQQTPKTLGDLIDCFSNILVDYVSDVNLRTYILRKIATNLADTQNTLTLKEYCIDKIRNFMNSKNQQEGTETEDYSAQLLDVELTYWVLWVDFINGTIKDNKAIFHTYHGTKGEEYNNVAIIMEKGFGRLNPKKFKNFFNHISDNDLTETNADIEDTRNLLYVSCSRAIKNLRLLYIDDISEIEDGVLKIFEEITPYQPHEAQITEKVPQE